MTIIVNSSKTSVIAQIFFFFIKFIDLKKHLNTFTKQLKKGISIFYFDAGRRNRSPNPKGIFTSSGTTLIEKKRTI